ncbi:MAG TPA: pyridoxamine 5'-phosphate oxidase family protein [Aeromicrobium sp.]|nr:pyridoxamine 5'-phosphate oxidase family protein [Aeromicrobium sp.]
MADFFESITDRLRDFIEQQHMFFVGTAARDGRVNVSPKGMDTFRVLGPNRVVWLNLTGSGNETAAHLLDTNRITLMFCSFDRKPLILRLYGTATEVQPNQDDWPDLSAHFPDLPGARQIFDVAIESVQTSCGYAVPRMTFDEERELLSTWANKKGPDGVAAYHQEKNVVSIDGLPTGMRT